MSEKSEVATGSDLQLSQDEQKLKRSILDQLAAGSAKNEAGLTDAILELVQLAIK